MAGVTAVLTLTVIGADSLVRTGETAQLSSSPVITPTSLKITLNKVELESSVNGAYKATLLNTPTTVDVVANTGGSGALFGSGTANAQTWNGMRVTLANTGTYSGIDPCTQNAATDATITLPNATNQGVILQYQVPHQVLGVPAGAITAQNYTVSTSSPLNVRVAFPVTNGVICASESPPLRTVAGSSTLLNAPFFDYVDTLNDEIGVAIGSGARISIYKRTDTGDVSPVRSINGPSTKLQGPVGIYVDTVNNEIGVSNTGNNSITVYPRDFDPNTSDVAPIRTIQGPNTHLDGPGAIYVDTGTQPSNVVDTAPDVIGVVNGASNTIAVYPRDAKGDAAPDFGIGGSNTQLNVPCGIYHYQDGVNDKLYVTNSNSNSVTVYDLTKMTTSGNVVNNFSPVAVIQGDHTGLSTPCGIYVDGANQEIAVANNGSNTITFYSVADNPDNPRPNAYPVRTISGAATGLSGPIGLALDASHDQVVVADNLNNALTVHKRDDATPFLASAPVLINGGWEQELGVTYVFSGTLSRLDGTPNTPTAPEPGMRELPGWPTAQFNGYRFGWKITSNQLRQPADATGAVLIPPQNEAFTLANGHIASTLTLGCNAFTPFSVLQLFTNCSASAPLIISPFPPESGSYNVAATLFGKAQNTPLRLHVSGLSQKEIPRLVPTITLGTNHSILRVDWDYYDGTGGTSTQNPNAPQPVNAPLPLLLTQQMQINLTQSYQTASSCYTQVAGNTPTLVYQSSSLGPDARSLTHIKNNNCDIFLDDVDTMTFTVSNAYGSQFVFKWKPI